MHASQKQRAGTSTRRHFGQRVPMMRRFSASSLKKRLAASPA